jgi:hypothetical protein
MAAEGVERIALVTEELTRYQDRSHLPLNVTLHDRRDMDSVQKELRNFQGVSVLIYDQTCAAEKRRRRKKGEYPKATQRVFINEAVCEGCGDCGVQSNCTSILPLETEFGRKRRIDQSNCNKDFSCIEGFCPSFVTVHGGKLRKADRTAADPSALFADLPQPVAPVLEGPFNILVTGIGGTGVVTIGALLGMAGHLENKGASVLDQTGLAQRAYEVNSKAVQAADEMMQQINRDKMSIAPPTEDQQKKSLEKRDAVKGLREGDPSKFAESTSDTVMPVSMTTAAGTRVVVPPPCTTKLARSAPLLSSEMLPRRVRVPLVAPVVFMVTSLR